MSLYPLKFQPLFMYRIWGGEKLRTILHKEYDAAQIGESWEISDVTNNQTVVAEGDLQGKTLTDLIEIYGSNLLGESVIARFGKEFPLLVKCIDAKTPLSIQVHPDNEVAKKRHNGVGKNEMWYIMQADDAAQIIIGFNQDTDQETFDAKVASGEVEELLHTENVAAGDLFYIPAGRVHAIGAGVLLAEIQQTSDITYRIYDYNRVDAKTGKKRQLHNDLAADVIDYTSKANYKTTYIPQKNKSVEVVNTPFFKTNIVTVSGELALDYCDADSFVILMCVEGSAKLLYEDTEYEIPTGSSVLVPASIDKVELIGSEAKLLEVTV